MRRQRISCSGQDLTGRDSMTRLRRMWPTRAAHLAAERPAVQDITSEKLWAMIVREVLLTAMQPPHLLHPGVRMQSSATSAKPRLSGSSPHLLRPTPAPDVRALWSSSPVMTPVSMLQIQVAGVAADDDVRGVSLKHPIHLSCTTHRLAAAGATRASDGRKLRRGVSQASQISDTYIRGCQADCSRAVLH